MIHKIVPKKGQKVINPEDMKVLTEKGILVRKISQHWKNQERDGDVTITKVTHKQAQKTQEKGSK